MLLASINQPIPLHVLITTGETSLHGQARVYNAQGTLSATVNLNHLNEGLYGALYTPTSEGVYTIVYQMYLDSGRTNPAMFQKQAESMDVSSHRQNIARILGLLHDNTVIDLQVYNSEGQLTSARIRAYDSSANAQIAGTTGLLYTWTVTAMYNSNNQLTNYSVVRV